LDKCQFRWQSFGIVASEFRIHSCRELWTARRGSMNKFISHFHADFLQTWRGTKCANQLIYCG
jgi:hypothetical protein